MNIRMLEAGDRAAWEPLWQGYLDFYKTSLPAEVTETAWRRLLDTDEPVHGLGAFGEDGRLMGIAHYIFHRSTWSPTSYCYLNDLFTVPAARGKGVGRALIERLYAEAAAAGATRVYWLTHETNETAQALYDRIADKPGFIQYRKTV
ncbi:MAG: GNAT family N-acetyltransferase [Aquamicrobium sp.]|uniref:GNAT family N-acetyltransferase n=1 Tax=Aquamicrobium sp. TaxID=1872579 RepID=UPI00349ED773|nr:GNAT family N-acetyltransferase [Aquamicrobium sp.]